MRYFKHRRSNRTLSVTEYSSASLSNALLVILTLSSILVYTRTVFRLVESAIGVESSAMRSQPLFAALETVPIMVTAVLWTTAPLTYLLKLK